MRAMRRTVSNGTRSTTADVVYEPVAYIQHVEFLDAKQDPDAADEPFVARCDCKSAKAFKEHSRRSCSEQALAQRVPLPGEVPSSK